MVDRLHFVPTSICNPPQYKLHYCLPEILASTQTTCRETMLPLEGKVAIVTGASRGIGAAIALLLAEQGAKGSPVLPAHPERLGANGRCRLPSRTFRLQADRLPNN